MEKTVKVEGKAGESQRKEVNILRTVRKHQGHNKNHLNKALSTDKSNLIQNKLQAKAYCCNSEYQRLL